MPNQPNTEAMTEAWEAVQPKSKIKRALRMTAPSTVAAERSWFEAGWLKARDFYSQPLSPPSEAEVERAAKALWDNEGRATQRAHFEGLAGDSRAYTIDRPSVVQGKR